MGKTGWPRLDRLMRTLHLYTGLFLVPWMMVYAASACCLNHGPWMAKTFDIAPPKWQQIRPPDDAFPAVAEDQAQAILRYLDLDACGDSHGKGVVRGRPRESRCDRRVPRDAGSTPKVPPAYASKG